MMKKTMLLIASTTLLSACGGEFSYKSGASVRDLEQTKKACGTSGGEEAQLACIRAQGWTITKLDDMDLFAEASVTENQPHARPESSKPMSEVDNTLDNNTSKAPSESKTPSTAKEQASQSEKATGSAATTQKPVPTVNDNTIYEISSWWKLGASAEMMKADMNTCVASLGEAHKPNPVAQTYTRAFVVCMFQKGWKGLKANKT
jgi:hypothetical protein